MRLIRKITVGLVLMGVLVSGLFARAQSPVTLTIDTRAHFYAIPEDFTGLGFETYAEIPDGSGVSGRLFSPTNMQLIILFTNSGIHNLRFGGGTVDGLRASLPTHADIDSVFGFARAARLKIIYSFRLLNGEAAATDAAADAKYIWDHYRPCLVGFAIGNETDVPSYLYPPFGKGTDPAITNYASCLAAWRKIAAAITNAVPDAKFVGPDAAAISGGWAARFARDVVGSGKLVLVTQHGYVGGRPFIHDGRENMPAPEAINHMLSKNWVTNKYPYYYSNTLALVAATGLPFRMTEANDYLHGVTNASNAFASALWALDYMHWWAAHGSAGVNFHNNQHTEWLTTDTFYLNVASREYLANPKAYAIRAFDQGGHGWAEPVVMGNDDGLNLTAYAVGDLTNLWVTIINKEHGVGARAATVTIAPDSFSQSGAEVMFMTAANGKAGATNGITLGGAPITNHSPWEGKWKTLALNTTGSCFVEVPATSAAIVKLSSEQK
jgi:hypothetical protein